MRFSYQRRIIIFWCFCAASIVTCNLRQPRWHRFSGRQKEKPGEIPTEDAACGKGQMLSQYGIISTYELASHLSRI